MKRYFVYVIFPLITGFSIYAMKYYQTNINHSTSIPFPGFIYYQLPDFLWMFASLNFLALVWKDNNKQLMTYQIFLLLLACTLELSQKFKYIPGTFDLKDIATYCLAFSISLMLFKLIFKHQNND